MRVEAGFFIHIIFADTMTHTGASSEWVEGGRVFGTVDEFGPLDSHILVVQVAKPTLGAAEDDEDDSADTRETTDDATDDSPGVARGRGAATRVAGGGTGGAGERGVGGANRGVHLAI